jgi:DNA-binding transcriptional ArsR family regulator
MTEARTLVEWLRAAGEPTRLRLLALCAQGEASVSELALAVGQSGPRVSRHLKILCAAGLLSRLRHRQWVRYRLGQAPGCARFLSALLADLDLSDPLFEQDRGRAQPTGAKSSAGSPVRSTLDQALGSFITASCGPERRASVLVVGVSHHAMLASAARVAAECTAVAHDRREAQAASAFAQRESLNCRVVATEEKDGPIARSLMQGGPRFDAVVLDRSTAPAASLPAWLAAGRRVLAPAGRLWLFERYESLVVRPQGVSAAPLARLRQLLDEAGFDCERLSPIQIDREHVLAAVAVPAFGVRSESVA